MRKFWISALIALVASFITTDSVAQELEIDAEYRVKPQYEKSFQATCAVIGSRSRPTSANMWGTGVLLKSGVVITNKHVVDKNYDGVIDDDERVVKVMFFYPKLVFRDAEVEFASPRRARDFENRIDIAVLRVKNPPPGGVELMSKKEYSRLMVGEDVYGLGVPAHSIRPHMAIGVLSTPNTLYTVRTSIPMYYGNSGGGVFQRSNGRLMGITVSIPLDRTQHVIFIWSNFISAPKIIDFFAHNDKLEYLADKRFF